MLGNQGKSCDQFVACWIAGLLILLVTHSRGAEVAGVTWEAPPKPVTEEKYDELHQIRPNWIAIVPYALMAADRPQLTFDSPRQWWGEKSEGVRAQAEAAKARGWKVMIKPQIWIWDGTYVGEMNFRSETDWKTWETSFKDYILTYARLAEELSCEALCIGTELDIAVRKRRNFWPALIEECRSVFSGKLTYAANWNSYQDPLFWGELDAIGVDAYFPIDADSPENSWERIRKELKAFHEKWGNAILFTEYGYRSVEGTMARPWEQAGEREINYAGQAEALQALYDSIWDEPWFAGGFLWKWILRDQSYERMARGYTVQGKPAEAIVREAYEKPAPPLPPEE